MSLGQDALLSSLITRGWGGMDLRNSRGDPSRRLVCAEISPKQAKQKKDLHTCMFIQTFLLSICCVPHTEDTGVNKRKFPALGS